MSDLISRQAAIDAVDEALTRVFVEHRDVAEKVINKIPSAQPETHEKRTETHACDLLSRQAAIDAEDDKIQLLHGDCLELMKDIPSGSVDLILTDPPYGTTACKWDSVIPFEPMWEHLNRIIKSNGAICLFGSEPFSSALRMSNIKHFKYDWIWEKEQGANFMLCKYQPYKVHEIVSVFSKATHKYFPQMTEGKPYISGKGTSGDITGNRLKVQTKNEGKRYPRSVQKFCTDKSKSKHPTQKPVALLEYLIRTYTNEGETVLDFTMGSGSTGVACVNLNRNFIGMELKQEYFNIATERINDARLNQQTGGD